MAKGLTFISIPVVLIIFAFMALLPNANESGQNVADALSNIDSQLVSSSNESIYYLEENIEDNFFFSTNHKESRGVISGILAMSKNGILQEKGDGNSNGSIRIFAGLGPDNKTAHIAILHVVSQNLSFAVLNAPIRSKGPGLRNIEGPYFFDPKDLYWECAWIMSSKIGHESTTKYWLNVSQGWDRWRIIQLRYNITHEIGRIPLPPSRFK